MNPIKASSLFAIALAVVSSVGPAPAATVANNVGTLSATTVFSGSLPSEADVQLEDFTLASPTALTIFSTSYAGGANLDGTTTAAGGFQPNIALWMPNGYILDQTTGSNPGNAGDPSTGIVGDSFFTTNTLPAGSYVLSIANWATTGDPVTGFVDNGAGGFQDVGGNLRNGSFTVNVSAADVASATPEPASVGLMLSAALAFVGTGLVRKFRTKQS